jgi:PKD repeat protein
VIWGNITGTPTTVGTYNFIIAATNTYGTANKSMSITISVASGVTSSYAFIG